MKFKLMLVDEDGTAHVVSDDLDYYLMSEPEAGEEPFELGDADAGLAMVKDVRLVKRQVENRRDQT